MTIEELRQEVFERGFSCSITDGKLKTSKRLSQEIIEELDLVEGIYENDDGDDDEGRPMILVTYFYNTK